MRQIFIVILILGAMPGGADVMSDLENDSDDIVRRIRREHSGECAQRISTLQGQNIGDTIKSCCPRASISWYSLNRQKQEIKAGLETPLIAGDVLLLRREPYARTAKFRMSG